MGESSAHSFYLKLLVANEENKVIMAESDKEFMEVLFSFMLMPIASVVRSTRDCLLGDIGCFNNLYQSVENLNTDFLTDKKFRDFLLFPRSAAEIYCKNLELNLIKNGRNGYYVCVDKDCNMISYYNTDKCRCGQDMKRMLVIKPNIRFFPEEEGLFLKSTARFMITDDFKVMPVAVIADLALLNELEKYWKVEERVVKIGRDEVLKLLIHSLRSQTPLSETFLEPPINKSENELVGMKYGPQGMNPSLNVTDFWKKRTNIHLKLIYNKVDNVALYAVVKEDFVNLLCTFLTIPLGYIFNQFPSLSFEGCLGNLHNSIKGTDPNLFCSKERKEILVNPKLSPGLPYNSNLIDIKESNLTSECSTLLSLVTSQNLSLWSKCNEENRMVFEGFLKTPSTFLVMDNLEVKPLSPISVKLLVDKLMVPLSDIGEREVILDEDKAMRLLAASLASEHALTSTFMPLKTNVDCLDFFRLMWGGNWGEKGTRSKNY